MGGMTPFSKTKMLLIIPAIPAAPSRWPMFALTAPLNRYVKSGLVSNLRTQAALSPLGFARANLTQ